MSIEGPRDQAPAQRDSPDGLVQGPCECVKCRYNLENLPKTGSCPECGTSVAQTIRGDLLLGNSELVDSDLGCISCEYPLRDLRYADLCPECGTPVADSLRGDLIFYRSVKYAARLLRGSSFVLNGILLFIASIFVLPVLAFATVAAGAPGAASLSMLSILLIALVLVSGLILYGWWLLTTKDPGISEDKDPRSRRVTRTTVVLYPAFVGIAVVAGILGNAAATGGLMDLVSLIVSIGLLAVVIVHLSSSMLYASKLAVNLPSLKVSNRARTRAIACPVLFIGTSIVNFVPTWFSGLLGLLGSLILLILYWNLLHMVRKGLKAIVRAQAAGATTPPVINIK